MKTNTDLMHKHVLYDTLSFKIIFLISYVVLFVVALFLIILPASQKSWLFSGTDPRKVGYFLELMEVHSLSQLNQVFTVLCLT